MPGEPADENTPFSPMAPYGVSKMAMEYYLNFYSDEHGLKYTSLRYGNVYGPRQDPHGEAGVVAIFSQRIMAGEPLTVYGDGEQTRDYVYVGDVARANLFVAGSSVYPSAGFANPTLTIIALALRLADHHRTRLAA